MTQFSDFGLASPIEKALKAEGYETPTPIQAQAIPIVMTGRDLLGIAQTGTGKTAAFALPVLNRLTETPRPRMPRSCRALVLSPTRELASQIAESFKAYGRNLRLSTAIVFGGVSISKQEKMLMGGVDIVVATPGRLLDLIDRRAISIKDIEILVLDEADQMLDLGFIHALKRIVTLVPKQRQSLFFSATMPKSIADLAAQFLNNPARVEVAPVATTAERVDQHVIFVAAGRKQALLASLLKDETITRTLVFTRTKHGADKVVKALEKDGTTAAAIHGNKSQSQRERALWDFKKGHCRVLVATDIAARGIDIDAVSHVFNYELPNVPEQYVHRIGRTARAGADGIAISFCNGEERAYLRDIEKLTRQKVPVMEAPEGFDLGRDEPQSEEAPRGRNGRPNGGRPGSGRPQHRPEGGRPQYPRSNDRNGPQGQRNEGRFADARPAEARPAEGRFQEARPSEGRPADPRRSDSRPQHPRRPEGGRGGEQRSGEPQRGGEQRLSWLDKPRSSKQRRPAR